MNDNFTTHPTEETLHRCVFNDCDETTRQHIEHCSECRDFVDSIRSISEDIASMAETPVPEQLDDAVMAIAGRSPRNGRQTALPFWSLNPLSLALLTALLLIALGVALVMLM